jgi:hypothetical protein
MLSHSTLDCLVGRVLEGWSCYLGPVPPVVGAKVETCECRRVGDPSWCAQEEFISDGKRRGICANAQNQQSNDHCRHARRPAQRASGNGQILTERLPPIGAVDALLATAHDARQHETRLSDIAELALGHGACLCCVVAECHERTRSAFQVKVDFRIGVAFGAAARRDAQYAS